MADDEFEDSGGAAGGRQASALDETLAMGSSGPMDPRAGAYLEEQTRLARQQAENLREQNAFELSHLRWRRFNDQMKGALQIMAVALGALIVVGIGAALWNASQADGLVVDSFTAPPDFVARGMGGDVVAADLTQHIAGIRRQVVGSGSLSSASSVSEGRDDVRVDIPNTGVSLGEVWRMLRAWLGDEQHVSGSLHEAPDGTLVLSASFAGGDVITETGKPAELDAMEERAAEKIFAHFDPTNAVIHLWTTGRTQEALAAVAKLATRPYPRGIRASVYALWSDITRDVTGDVPLAISHVKIGLALDPKIQVAHSELANAEAALGHDETALRERRAALAQGESDQPKALQGANGFESVQQAARLRVDTALGDFGAAEAAGCGANCLPDTLDGAALMAARRHDVRGTYGSLAGARAAGAVDTLWAQDATYYTALDEENWQQAVALALARGLALAADYTKMSPQYLAVLDKTTTRPMLAEALARSGDIAGAEATIASTPLDCYACVRTRGVIAAEKKDWAVAERWFAIAVAQAPSIPFADVDWARMKLAKGDLAGAIAKLDAAAKKGLHFADARELWGEALVVSRRSDLAVPKFASAARDAPNWGRLHLKWGEALLWSGDAAGAKKQFALAAGLFLTAREKTELVRVEAGVRSPAGSERPSLAK